MTKEELQQAVLSALIQHSAYTSRLSSASVNEILKQFDKMSNSALNELLGLLNDLSDAELTALAGDRYTTPALKEVKSVLDDWMVQINTVLPELFTESAVALAAYEASYIYKLADKEAPAISGESLFNKVKNKPYGKGYLFKNMFPGVSYSLRKSINETISNGISNGQTNQQIIQRIKGTKAANYGDGLLNIARQDIEAEVRTARSSISSDIYLDTYKALGAEYVMDIATIDFRTTKLCSGLDHRIQKLDSNTRRPPYHYRCRTVQIMVDKDGNLDGYRPFVASDKPVSKIPKDQRQGIIGQIDANTSYPEWFAKQDEDHQKAWLGASRFRLYRSGKYPIERFTDPLSGKLFTLEELKALDGKSFKNAGL